MKKFSRGETITVNIKSKTVRSEDIAQIIFTVRQGDNKRTLFINDMTLVENEEVPFYRYKFSQAETLAFNTSQPVLFQIDLVDIYGDRSRVYDEEFEVGPTEYGKVVQE